MTNRFRTRLDEVFLFGHAPDLETAAHPEGLRRVAIATLELGDLESGKWRVLRPTELSTLKAALGLITKDESWPS